MTPKELTALIARHNAALAKAKAEGRPITLLTYNQAPCHARLPDCPGDIITLEVHPTGHIAASLAHNH
jgi:hypothetical protein